MIKSILKRIENIRNCLFPPIPDEQIDMIVNGKPYDYSQPFDEDGVNYFDYLE